jgi:hypothetical protein
MGTSIAVVDLQVYYQDVKGWLRDYISGPRGWQQGNLLVEVPPRTPLAAVYWRDNGDVRVYYRSYSNEVVEIVYAENKWRARPNRLTACIGNSQISAALRDSIEVFYQQNPNALQEYRTDGGCWRTRTEVPTGMRV